MAGTGIVVRADGEGEKRWFYGGGLHTWKATAEETGRLRVESYLIRSGAVTCAMRASE